MHPALSAHFSALTFGPPPPPRDPVPAPGETTAILGSLLRHELAAVDAYRRACGMTAHHAFLVELRRLQDDHHQSSELLHRMLRERHAQPAAGPGVWGVVVCVAENTASLLGRRMVVATLHELEHRGVADYRHHLPRLDELTRAQVETELLPTQEGALAIIAGLSAHPPEDAA